jgi:hypothetical protein
VFVVAKYKVCSCSMCETSCIYFKLLNLLYPVCSICCIKLCSAGQQVPTYTTYTTYNTTTAHLQYLLRGSATPTRWYVPAVAPQCIYSPLRSLVVETASLHAITTSPTSLLLSIRTVPCDNIQWYKGRYLVD